MASFVLRGGTRYVLGLAGRCVYSFLKVHCHVQYQAICLMRHFDTFTSQEKPDLTIPVRLTLIATLCQASLHQSSIDRYASK